MKTKISFVLVAFLILLGIAKSEVASAQLRTVPMTYVETYSNLKQTPIPVECDGVVMDHLSGKLDVFCRMFGYFDPAYPGDNNHFHSLWMIHNYSGFLTGEFGEVYEISGVKKLDMMDKDFTFHLNIKGNLGDHYILFASGTNNPNYTFTVDRAVCPSGSGQ